MALKSPMMPSPTGGLSSSFSPYSDSPNSPARFGAFSGSGNSQSNRSSMQNDTLAPPRSPYPQQIEPSPVDSNGTEGTEIEDDAQEDSNTKAGELDDVQSPDVEILSPGSTRSELPPKLDTHLSIRSRSDSNDDAPQSVIHIPQGFKSFDRVDSGRASDTHNDNAVASPVTPEAAVLGHEDKVWLRTVRTSHVSRARLTPAQKHASIGPVKTDVPRVMDRSTPRAQTRQEADEEHKRRSRRTFSLEGIPEAADKDGEEPSDARDDDGPSTAGLVGDGVMSQAIQQQVGEAETDVSALRMALSECWTLCNTLAGLSSSHRTRTFKFSGRSEVQEQAWRHCWRLCQQLYESRDEDPTAQMIPTLELCRDFCQSLFEARQKTDEASDSVLRVSFELNNHLYNTHDRSLPNAFNERTLEFYITICHRLMKQRTSLPQETDSLLRACWSLAEMLFNIRQNNQEGRAADEELIGSAVQACWDLCDLFREGWSQIRPDRGTPRAGQTTFPAASSSSLVSYKAGSVRSNRSGGRSVSSSHSAKKFHDAHPFPPETPVTVFDETSSTAASSPDSATAPNILVLGPASIGTGSLRGGGSHHDRWTSSASVLSDYSESAVSSQHTSSTATAAAEETHLLRIRCLLLRAGMNAGYTRAAGQSLPAFVQTLPDTAFGLMPWQMKVLTFYRKLVTGDKSMATAHGMPARRLGAAEVAKSVRWLGSSEQWAWMRDLFRIVFNFGIDDSAGRNASFTI